MERPRSAAGTLAMAMTLALGVAGEGNAQEAKPDGSPRVVAVWPTGPLEVVAAFDGPLAPEAARWMVGQTISYHDPKGERPGSGASSASAGRLRIVGARLRDNGRTLVLATDPHPRQALYQLPIPRLPEQAGGGSRGTVPYDLSGAEATWSAGEMPGDGPSWSGWWPALDLREVRRLTNGSRPHEAGWALMERGGRLSLGGWVSLPPGPVTVRIDSSVPIEEATLGDAQAGAQAPGIDNNFRAEMAVESRGEPMFFTAAVRTGNAGRALHLNATYRVAGRAGDQPIGRDHLRLPWAPAALAANGPAPVAVPNLSGGDPGRGREIFRGDRGRCAHCHAFRGEGGQVGPDLNQIASKGRADIYRSLAAPSAEIAPDYITYTVATRDGQVLSGVVRAEGPDAIRVTDTNARVMTLPRADIQEIRPSATSIMPPGLAAAIGDSGIRDLIAYLTSPAPASAR